MQLVVITVPGNWFNVQAFVNGHGLAEGVVAISETRGNYVNVAIKINETQEEDLRKSGWITGTI